MSNPILTVSQLNISVKQTLEQEFRQIWLVGEISNFSQPVSGHWYLTLKDEHAQVRAAMFRMKNMRVNFRPQNGMQVLVRASVGLYEARGDYQILIETMQPAGDGLLQQQFEQLKMKLAAEGLFAQAHKKMLPTFIKSVGVITSASGAALQDILHILKRRDPSLNVIIYPTLVQGKEATQGIIQMITLANQREECDVLIVGRGGGSLEDLWCFNEESLARAIYHSTLPIISAVGHETDVTIADFVADIRAATPSAAAELVSRDRQELQQQLQHQFDKISLAFDRLWSEKTGYFQHLRVRLNAQHPARQLQLRQQILNQLQKQAERAIQTQLVHSQQKWAHLTQRLNIQHPLRNLQKQQQQLAQLKKQATQHIEQIFLRKQQYWKFTVQRVNQSKLPHQIAHQQQYLDKITQRLHYQIEKKQGLSRQSFQTLCIRLEGLSPLKVLARGYSVTQNEQGKALLNSTEVKIGEKIVSRLAYGNVVSEVIKIA